MKEYTIYFEIKADYQENTYYSKVMASNAAEAKRIVGEAVKQNTNHHAFHCRTKLIDNINVYANSDGNPFHYVPTGKYDEVGHPYVSKQEITPAQIQLSSMHKDKNQQNKNDLER